MCRKFSRPPSSRFTAQVLPSFMWASVAASLHSLTALKHSLQIQMSCFLSVLLLNPTSICILFHLHSQYPTSGHRVTSDLMLHEQVKRTYLQARAVAQETPACTALLWKHSPQNKAQRYHASPSVHSLYDTHSHCGGLQRHTMRSPISWSMPCYDQLNNPTCALISHSDRTLPRHIWFLVRLIMFNNVCGYAHPSRAPFTCMDITPGHGCLEEGKRRLLTIVHRPL